MGALKEYDPKQVTATWDGIDLTNGIVDGTFITVARTERTFTLNVGADGGGTRVKSNNRSAIITLSLRDGADTNGLLSDRVLDEEKENPTTHVRPMTIKDLSGNTLHSGPQVFLDGPAEDGFANEEGTKEWTFLALEMKLNSRGSNEA